MTLESKLGIDIIKGYAVVSIADKLLYSYWILIFSKLIIQVSYLISFYLFEYLTNLKVKFGTVLKISQL